MYHVCRPACTEAGKAQRPFSAIQRVETTQSCRLSAHIVRPVLCCGTDARDRFSEAVGSAVPLLFGSCLESAVTRSGIEPGERDVKAVALGCPLLLFVSSCQ